MLTSAQYLDLVPELRFLSLLSLHAAGSRCAACFVYMEDIWLLPSGRSLVILQAFTF